MTKKSIALSFLMALLLIGTVVLASSGGPGITPDQAEKRLVEGNQRFVSESPMYPRTGKDRRHETSTGGQHPFATLITCSDSRVPAEIVFDQGIGDLFIIRVAGNVCDVDEVGSIEYGVDHLGTPIMVVLGHSQCGAVTAVVTDAELHGSIPPLVDNIEPAVARTKRVHPELDGNELVEMSVKFNVWQSIQDLFQRSSAVRERVRDGRLMVVGAVYHLDDGHVEWLGAHPDQSQLMAYKDKDSEQHSSSDH